MSVLPGGSGRQGRRSSTPGRIHHHPGARRQSALPTAEGLSPYNYGELHYRGEGPYEGLEFHYYLSASNSGGAYAGWIGPSD